MATNSKIESMPTELKIALLEQVSDIHSLSALIHASPIFHAVYLANREDILTKTTLQEMSTKDQSLNINELMKSAVVCHLGTKNGKLNPNVEPAIIACQAQANTTTDIKLTVDHCIALRTLRFYYGWQIAERQESEPDQRLLIACNKTATREEWSDQLRACIVHFLVLGDYDPREVVFSRSWSAWIGTALEAWFDALFFRIIQPLRVGRVWISGDGVPVTA